MTPEERKDTLADLRESVKNAIRHRAEIAGQAATLESQAQTLDELIENARSMIDVLEIDQRLDDEIAKSAKADARAAAEQAGLHSIRSLGISRELDFDETT